MDGEVKSQAKTDEDILTFALKTRERKILAAKRQAFVRLWFDSLGGNARGGGGLGVKNNSSKHPP